MKIHKEWWYLKRFDKKPAMYVKKHHVKTIRDQQIIENLSYLKELPIGWYAIGYNYFVKKRGGIKGHPMKTFWHILIKDNKKVAERWSGSILDGIRYVKTIEL